MAEEQAFPWQPGTATGIGSMPGDNPMEAARTVVSELPDLPYLAELPGRGPGADTIGRSAALLVDIPVEVTTRGWRIAERPGRDVRRAKSMLSSDLDTLEEVLDGYQGLLKIQVAGPWTLAASIEQPHSLNPALADPGLVADLAASLAEGAAAHVAEVAKRVPKAALLVQLDEPSLPAVAQGAVATPSGLSRVRAVEEETLRDRLREVLAAARGPAGAPGALSGNSRYAIVHCCAAEYPFTTVTASGADAVSFDMSLLRHADYDALAETAEAGAGLLVGADAADTRATGRVREAAGGSTLAPVDTAKAVRELWRMMGLPPARCAAQVVITPACGLASASPSQARDALRWCREAARILPELMDELA